MEILFRGRSKLNGKWHFGSLIKGLHEDWDFIITEGTEQEDFDLQTIRIITNSIGQYIGKKDKNGKKVFVGDVVETKIGDVLLRFVVVFDQQLCAFLLEETYSIVQKGLTRKVLAHLEIKGNVHNNPEMITPN